jgi:FkbM family methyltransferase
MTNKGSVSEYLRNGFWSSGVRFRDIMKRVGLLGPFDAFFYYLGQRLIKPPAKEIEVDLPYGIRMAIPPNWKSARNYATDVFERETSILFQKIAKDGMNILDVGANIGYYTLIGSRLVGVSGRIHAFEPESKAYEYLSRNVSTNKCSNVVKVAKAVSDRQGPAIFICNKPEEGFISNSSPSNGGITVQTISLDAYFSEEGWPPVDIIKMDIEGGEHSALRGMKELSQKNPELKLIMEFNRSNIERAGTTTEEIAYTLFELGFRRGYIIERGMKAFSVNHEFPEEHVNYNLLLEK